METTVNWLKKYCPVTQDVDEIERLLTMSGSEVEERHAHPASGDTALKLEITSNRTDCYGTLGLARELSAITGTPLTPPDFSYKTISEKTANATSVTIECPDLCPYYTAQLIRGVKVGSSPKWLLDLFEALAGVKNIRPVNNVVDITNFVLLELAQPLHAFDFDKMAARKVVVRRAKKGEKIRAINDVEYVFDAEPAPEKKPQDGVSRVWYWDENVCVIADGNDPQCIGGVMGGKDTEITEATTNILLESAYFDPMNNRRTSRGMELHSDSSFRFTRGVDPAGVLAASRRCAKLIAEICGGEVYEGIIEAGEIGAASHTITFRQSAIERTLGIDVPQSRVIEIFTGLGLEVAKPKGKKAAESLDVTAPSFRRDLVREIDLVEEVGRIVGFDQVPTESVMRAKTAPPKKVERVTDRLRDLLVGAGYFETVSASFVPEMGPKELPDVWRVSPWPNGGECVITNPVVAGQGMLRPSMAQSLLGLRKSNQLRGSLAGVRLFEIGRVYGQHLKDSSGTTAADAPALERRVLGITSDGADAFLDLKGIVELIAEDLQLPVQYGPLDYPLIAGGIGAEITVGDGKNKRRLGVLGQVARAVLDAFELQAECAIAELDADLIVELAAFGKAFRELPRFPGMMRELALVLPEAALWQEIEGTVRQSAGELLVGVDYLDEYRGKQIPKGKKQYNLAMHFLHEGRSLTSEEINEVTDAVIAAVGKQHGAELRK